MNSNVSQLGGRHLPMLHHPPATSRIALRLRTCRHPTHQGGRRGDTRCLARMVVTYVGRSFLLYAAAVFADSRQQWWAPSLRSDSDYLPCSCVHHMWYICMRQEYLFLAACRAPSLFCWLSGFSQVVSSADLGDNSWGQGWLPQNLGNLAGSTFVPHMTKSLAQKV